MPPSPNFRPETTHLALGDAFFDVVKPADFSADHSPLPERPVGEHVGLRNLSDAEWIAHFGRFRPLPGSLPEPLALRYHGHQFRSYNRISVTGAASSMRKCGMIAGDCSISARRVRARRPGRGAATGASR